MSKRYSAQAGMVAGKALTYSGMMLVLVMVLREFDFKLGALLGTAGVVGIAVGFASQTSLSNVVSGLFLVSERPFAVGDVVKIGEHTGVVLSIDLLSVKLRTFDNRFVRVPNETFVKSDMVNITRFPIRRMDMTIGVAYKEDIARVTRVLQEVIDANPFCLDEPEPLIWLSNFADSALELFVGVWFAKDDVLSLRQTLLLQIKERFDAEKIEIPFPHQTLYTGSVTEPFPIRVVGADGLSPTTAESQKKS
jgi:small-conductance mechanosensitive channel